MSVLWLFLRPGLSDAVQMATVGDDRRRELPFVVVRVRRLVPCALGNLRANSVAECLSPDLLGGHVVFACSATSLFLEGRHVL